MANFPTHIAVGTVVSGALATVTMATDMVAPENIVAVTLAGVLGSVLPDIDLKDSRPARAMFAGLAVFFSFAVLFSLERKYSIVEMLVLWMGTLVFVRYVAKEVFFNFSYHRGIWHSLLAMAFCAFVTAWVYSSLLGRNEGVAWLAAGFMAIGYLTHLVLDEIYSVDVMDTRIKASFGSAVKPIDFKHPGHSAAMAAATVAAFLLAPPIGGFVKDISSRSLWTSLQQRLLPHETWFGVDWRKTAWLPGRAATPKPEESAPAAAAPAAGLNSGQGSSPISTGSIPQPILPATPPPSATGDEPRQQR